MTAENPARRLGTLLARWCVAAFTLDTRSLAAYRIGLGLILVADCLLRTRDFSLMFTPDGIFPLEPLARFHATATVWSLAFLHDSAWWSGTVLALEGVAGVALTLGWHTRVATIAAWVALVSVIRRTSPAVNAGDMWLACQLLWSMFLPLGARWSLDAFRTGRTSAAAPLTSTVCSPASATLVLQILVVYFSAGLAKCNAGWVAGESLAHALSVHDHGTPLGMMLGGIPWLSRLLQWSVVTGELILPLAVLACPTPRIRGLLVAVFVAFHLGVWLGMAVGLFPAIGIVAWLPLVPAAIWPADRRPVQPAARLTRVAAWACGLAASLAAVSFIHHVTPWRRMVLPPPVVAALNLLSLSQEWEMFGGVLAQEQWVYSRALLADGSEVDLLRDGQGVEPERPAGGATSLPHHRWHKFLGVLTRPSAQILTAPAAAGLARQWNARHGPTQQVVSLDIRFGLQAVQGNDNTVLDFLVASWPPRSAAGEGNLERFLQE